VINGEKLILIHTAPFRMYKNIKEKIKEIIPLEMLAKVAYVSFFPF
jgi:hypothetical protein